jgi:FlaG/FlaF family flagellin (archaellin)
MLAMDARMLGFVIGAVLMVAIPTVAGTAASFF